MLKSKMNNNLITILKAGLHIPSITTAEVEVLKCCGAEEWKAMADLGK